MSDHITGDELKQYFEIVLAEAPNEDDADFVNEVETHAAECSYCFEKMQAARLLMQGFSSSPDLAASFIDAEFPESLARPAFDIQKVFAGVKVVKAELEGKIRMLADTLSDKMNVVFTPCHPSLAAVRGDHQISTDGGTLNDLLYSDMEIPLEEGRKITLRCRNTGTSGQTRLYVYSNFEVDFILASGENILRPEKRDYDKAVNEYVWVYELDGQEFELTAR